MAVVNGKSSLIGDHYGADPGYPVPELARGREVHAVGSVENGATDSQDSDYLLARLPSQAVLTERTFFKADGWGFAQVVIGIRGATTALLNVAKSGDTVKYPVAVGDGKHGQPLWQALGLTADPGGEIALYATAAAAATGAGSMKFRFSYLMP